ncbi:MAG: hypothetical protein CSA07_00835 [Bacteroidia bacterium]|nr:MAG: hypothetical protein CSA07_00835 [Bacteroidia bacterium]
MDKHPPLTPEELASFTAARLQKAQGSDKRHWRAALRQLVAELGRELGRAEQARRPRRYHNSGEDLERTDEMLQALLSCPTPDLEVKVHHYPAKKGEERRIKRIDYSIDGYLVLRLSHYSPHFRPFFGGSYTQDERIFSLDLLRLMLPRYARFCTEGMLALNGKKHEQLKEAKIRSVATGSVGVMAKSLLATKRYAHHLRSEQKSEVLRVRLNERQRAELRLPYSSFVQKAKHLLPTLAILDGLLAESPLPLGIGYVREHIGWGQTHRSKLNFPGQGNSPQLLDYQREELKRLAQLFPPDRMDYFRLRPRYTKEQLEGLAELKIPGLDQSVSSHGYRHIPTITYSQQGREFLIIDEEYVALSTWRGWETIMLHEPRHYLFRQNMLEVLPLPPFEQLADIIPRLASYALEQEKQASTPEYLEIQRRRNVQLELERIIPPIMEASGEQYALELPNSWDDCPARLHVHDNARRTITLYLSYTDAANVADHVRLALELARKAVADAPMAFQLRYSEDDKTIWTEF